MLLSSILLFSLFSCTDTTENKNYYPVNAWIADELKMIDSLHLPVKHIKMDIADTSGISNEAFRKIAMGLLTINFEQEEISKLFKEEVLDEGDDTNISITYTADENSEGPLQKIQLNIKPGESSPKSIYAERRDVTDDLIIIRKIIWESRHSLTVASVYYRNNQAIQQSREKFEWGF